MHWAAHKHTAAELFLSGQTHLVQENIEVILVSLMERYCL